IAIVTTFDRDDYLFAALDAGASGFLLKNAGPEELVTAVRVLAAGDGMLAPEVTRRVIGRFAGPPVAELVEAPGTGPSTAEPVAASGTGRAALAEPFTDREQEVLELMAQALSNAEIAAR